MASPRLVALPLLGLLLAPPSVRATFPDGGQEPRAHSGWTPTLGFGAGVRQLFGQRFFAAGELRVRRGSGPSGTGLTLAAGLHL